MKRDHNDLPVFPDWMIDAVPGARAAFDEMTAAQEPMPALLAEQKAAIKAAVGLGKWTGPVGATVYGPAPGVSSADFDAAEARKREAAQAIQSASRKGAAAYRRFHELMQAADHAELRKLAARRALAAQADAQSALAALRDALDRRAEADEVAGMPGTAWEAHPSAPADARNATAQAWRTLRAMVDHFDTAAQERTAEGERVPTLRTLADRINADNEAAKAAMPKVERRTAGF